MKRQSNIYRSAGARVIRRMRQCARCKRLSTQHTKTRWYAYCLKYKQRLCDMNTWEDCQDPEPINTKGGP